MQQKASVIKKARAAKHVWLMCLLYCTPPTLLLQYPHVLLTFGKAQDLLRMPKRRFNVQKRVWACSNFVISTSKYASCHCHVRFFHITTSKSWQKCFAIILCLEAYFRPQRRAFSTSQPRKMFKPEVFLAFWLGNVVLATMVCTFSTSQLPKLFPCWGCLSTLWRANLPRATTACNF